MAKTVVFVTGNDKKFEEVTKILDSSAVTFKRLSLDLDELQGSSKQIVEHKVRQAAHKVDGPVFVEDVSLCFAALNGMPGPYIKYFLENCGLDGLVTMLRGFDNYAAQAVCTVGYCEGPGRDVHIFEGVVEGTIVHQRGGKRFGWDPIFQPAGLDVTYAEMAVEDKNKMSHRFLAFSKLRDFLATQPTP
eukprot:CAMPEP_0177651438 /NCGR_PEP_ID=MMETSP0447-20121125/12548_1 /TAXON_ID=0 /ORGANISM="Stygamoeba regulata, Strain BSH-02190019" /LENGTH=188 /DNA_ID=CAMNT_0019154519 /DNA_START=164 /DNA_END=730 /DNA_ORIENTATION=-